MGTIRQRRQKKDFSSKPSDDNKKAKQQQQKSQEQSDDENNPSSATTRDVILRHPLFWLLILVGIPYFVYLGYRWIVLQHPFVSLGMRPPVGNTDIRQVLIIGSMSSGTSSIADSLRHDIGIEVDHEDSDTLWKTVRDGTVSWFHGIRYWNIEGSDESRIINGLCRISWTFKENYGFGPTLFGNPQYNCSFVHPQFKECFHHACVKSLTREYGCALKKKSCIPPFQTTLLQTREPWKIVQSLSAKYCLKEDSDDKTILEKPPTTLSLLLAAMGLIKGKENCIEQMMLYVIGYYNMILNNDPKIVFYPIETTTPCEVAALSGLDDLSTTVYEPNNYKYLQKCKQGRS